MLADRRHQHVKRGFDRRIVSIQIGARLVELAAESRPAGNPGKDPIESGPGRVQAQPSTFDHAFQPRPVPHRNGVGLSRHLDADMLDEGVETHAGVARPASRKAVVEEYVQEHPGVPAPGRGDAGQTRSERVVGIREPVDGAVERDPGRDAGRNRTVHPAPDEVRADVSGAYLVVVG